jgi:4-amino-4-deoxy-L-arabinose transferase-like glycosyltransferase
MMARPERLSATGDIVISDRQFVVCLVATALIAALLRVVYPTADAPWQPAAGVTWHDEGAWVHNARNKALFGEWQADRWNPMFIAPVFTGLEYLSFRSFGVGFRQARLVSEVAGVLAVVALGLGVARLSNKLAGLLAAAMLATTFISITFDRTALMEATMVAFMVLSWCAYARASERPLLGLFSGVLAVLAFFTKASAVCFVAALGLAAVLDTTGWCSEVRDSTAVDRKRRIGFFVLAGLILGGVAAVALFVGPNWAEYRFYNWQMSVTRKPSYNVGAIADRASWFPIIHDFFTRVWLVTVVALFGGLGLVPRFRRLAAGQRLLLMWIAFGMLELILHDDGNERRFVLLIPPLIAVAAIMLASERRLLSTEIASIRLSRVLLWSPVLLFAFYTVCGALLRLLWIYEVRPGVRISATAATILAIVVLASWPRVPRWLARDPWSARGGLSVAALIIVGNLVQFTQWAVGRTYKNYEASVAIGQWLPAGTLVHGKLANGLALENGIRPLFVGRGFGNYEDRTTRRDVRYLLTYTSPRIGYEGSVITEVLAACPGWRILRGFDVAETPGGHDRAALVDKYPNDPTGNLTDARH